MSSPDDLLSDRAYLKCKLTVRKWEKEFFKTNGRIPSKYDIKEAAVEVRKAYSKYFQMKSRALEMSLDVDLSSPPASPLPPDTPSPPKSFPDTPKLPSALQIHQLITTPPSTVQNDRVWGEHLNHTKQLDAKTVKKSTSVTPKMSQNLFKNCSFNKRNPRKSLTAKNLNKSESVETPIDSRPTETIPNEIQQSKSFNIVSTPTSVSLNTIQTINAKVRTIDTRWLNRCSEKLIDSGQSAVSNSSQANYGLRNVNVEAIVPAADVDCIENSESESERNTTISQFKRIKQTVKRAKIEPNVASNTKVDTSLSGSADSSKEVKPKPKSRIKKKVTKAKQKKVAEADLPPLQDEKEEENVLDMLNVEKIDMPRFAIDPSILKEKNLVEGLVATLKLPKQLKTEKKYNKKTTEKENGMLKKIENGTLNENFVRINIEKKVFVRGKNSVNFSRFKKQQWKNKKKALNELGPEFPEGGVLKCFRCNGIGHMSRYCQAHKGNTLLPLEECVEKSDLLSLKDVEDAQITIEENFTDEVLFESMTNDVNWDEGMNEEKSDGIPQTYLKLLPKESNSISPQTIEPLYPLDSDSRPMNCTQEVKDALKLFEHTQFRNGQEVAIMRILSGLSTLVTLSTGSGKSLCYQIPAYIYAQHNKCITLVVSPLVSLMEDQVVNMPSFLRAACLHTNQTATAREKVLQLIKSGNIDILLVSPEAIVSGKRSTGFGSLLKDLPPIAFACIDEVHCVSQWSHNFRPSYLMICRVLREKMGVKCILGLTATATKSTVNSVIRHLDITDGFNGVITNVPLPDNLTLTVSRDVRKDQMLLELLQTERFSQCNSIIIYCIRRDECERIATLIRTSMQNSKDVQKVNRKRKRYDCLVEAYHAGMSAARRRRVQENFMGGSLKIVVATVAFGMGINKSDIRSVIHYNMPNSFESYVQEVGRAGRDGLPAQCHVFVDYEARDKHELLRHIHANSIERHVIRKLLQKIFIPCACKSMNIEKCQGHEVAFSVDETVNELDVPTENISTLLCYLELHDNNYIKVMSSVYILCKVMSYGGPAALNEAAQKCPPLAMAIALEKKKGNDVQNLNTFEFRVVDVAAAIGWESGLVKFHLKNLEWEKSDNRSKKTVLRVEFNTLGFRVKAPGDLDSSELDVALDSLYERTQLQEKTMLYQLQKVSKTLLDVSFQNINECSELKFESQYNEHSQRLKTCIREYFTTDIHSRVDLDEVADKAVNENQIVSEVRGLISTYRDCSFTGRAIARIFQGISSPNYPAIVWGRCRYWRSHIGDDFYKICNIAKQQIMLMK